MSLVGNLEDLSLGDILQIISLSQKSGVLALSSELGSGRIVFANGLVQAACVKGEPNDLRDLLVTKGEIDPAGFDASVAHARDLDQSVESVLDSDLGLGPERVEALIREAVETAILEMFSWPSGDFSFDVRTELDADDPALRLEQGLNAQYLAMEGLRIRDERAREGGETSGVDANEVTQPDVGRADDPLFGDDTLEVDPLPLETAADVLVASAIDGDDDLLTLEEVEAALPIPSMPANESPPEPREEAAAPASTARAPRSADVEPSIPCVDTHDMPVVLIDPEVAALDWVKAAIEDDFARVHVFQQAEQGLSRIRQYLIRGQVPLVLVSPRIQIDPLSGIRGLGDFIRRLKAQSPRIVVLGLCEEDDTEASMPGSLNGVLRRPPRRLLADPGTTDGAAASQVLSRALVGLLGQSMAGTEPATRGTEPTAAGDPASAASLRALRDATTKLQAASSRGEILPVVLDFASELFARVAILVVREDSVFAVAGRGIPALEVDPLDAGPSISFELPQVGWIRRVLETGKPVVAAPQAEADVVLIDRFGGERPKQAYLGPIESGAGVIAVLYGDQSPRDTPMPDTHGLEVVLQHAGLALDRAALERALWEVDANA